MWRSNTSLSVWESISAGSYPSVSVSSTEYSYWIEHGEEHSGLVLAFTPVVLVMESCRHYKEHPVDYLLQSTFFPLLSEKPTFVPTLRFCHCD